MVFGSCLKKFPFINILLIIDTQTHTHTQSSSSRRGAELRTSWGGSRERVVVLFCWTDRERESLGHGHNKAETKRMWGTE